ncbi:MAG TPA: DUF4349 domain-containing protein [Pseudonocardiaceae bacterium]
MRSRHALLGGLLIGCCVLVGCSAGSNTAASSAVDVPANGAPLPNKAATGGAQSGQSAGGTAQPGRAPVPGNGGGQAAAPVNPLPATGRQVIRSASISLSVPDVTTTAGRVRQITAAAGGFTSTENTLTDQADFTLQVPVSVLDHVLDQLAALGHPIDRGAQAQDVTSQLVDVQSRIASQQASVNRVRGLLDKATSISDIVSIESELATREANLESLEQQQAELSGQVAMSTVTVHIGRSTAPPPPPARAASTGGFLGGLSAGWHSFVVVVVSASMVLGALLPYLLGLGVPAALIWWFVRRRRERRVPAPMIEPDAG